METYIVTYLLTSNNPFHRQLHGQFRREVAQGAKFAKKVHKPPLWVNVINFELNGLDASMWGPWNPSDPKKS